uniref:Uncharacterized protein n=1 Tax=Cacopsylla melanoneura TaxID=428564 RepID=A0A8D8RSH3_9HEMI
MSNDNTGVQNYPKTKLQRNRCFSAERKMCGSYIMYNSHYKQPRWQAVPVIIWNSKLYSIQKSSTAILPSRDIGEVKNIEIRNNAKTRISLFFRRNFFETGSQFVDTIKGGQL